MEQAQIDQIVQNILLNYPPDYLKQWADNNQYLKYQQDPVGFGREILGETYTKDVENMMISVRDHQMTVAISGNSTGKCVEENERIILSNGTLVVAKDLIGQKFSILSFGDDWKQKSCSAFAFDNGVQPVFKVSIDGGREIVRTGNHPLWAARLKKTKNSKHALLTVVDMGWKTISELSSEDIVAVPTKLNTIRHNEQDEDDIKLAAYLLADGCIINDIRFTKKCGIVKNEFVEIIERMGCIAKKTADPNTIRITTDEKYHGYDSNPIRNIVKSWGIFGTKSKHKRFPDWIWRLSDDQLGLFLNRLFSCDGWAYSKITKKGNRTEIGYSSASKDMIEDVYFAALRLGIRGDIVYKLAKCDGKSFDAWVWTIRDKVNIDLFNKNIGLFGKQEALDRCVDINNDKTKTLKWPYVNIPSGYKWEKVKSVEYIGDKPTVGISVPTTNVYLTDFVEHNTHSSASLALWFYLCHPSSLIFTAAAPPLDNLKRLLWGEIGKKISKCKDDIFNGHTYNVMHLCDSEWHYITGVAIPQSGAPEQKTAKFSGKHSPYMLFIVDEADAVPDEIFTGIEGCMSGGHVRLLCMFNPRIMAGYVYRKIRDNQCNVVHLSAFNHPNVVTGKEVYPGAVSREITVKRINECSIPLYATDEPDQYTFEVPKFLVGCTAKNDKGVVYPPLQPGYRKVTDARFFHQVLGRFGPQGANQLVPQDAIDRARYRWDDWVSRHGENPPELVRPIYGLDVADLGDDSNCRCKRYGDWVARFTSWKGIHPNESAERVADEAKIDSSLNVNVDSIGIGVDVAPLLRKAGVKASGINIAEKPTKEYKKDEKNVLKFFKLRDQLYWDTAEWIKSDYSMLPPDERLIEEAMCITYEEDKTTRKIRVLSKDKMKDALGRSPDHWDSLTLTFAPKPRSPKARIL